MNDENIVPLIARQVGSIQIVLRAILDGIVEASEIDRSLLFGFLKDRRDQTTDDLAKMLLSDLIRDDAVQNGECQESCS